MKQPNIDRFDPKSRVKPEKVNMEGMPTIGSPLSQASPEAPERTKTERVVSSKVETNKPTMTPSNHDTTVSLIDDIRRLVKELGKEAATYRFTKEEKDKLKDLVYIYSRQDLRTSENEITRIAINWLFKDHEENGEKSVIYSVLKALNA